MSGLKNTAEQKMGAGDLQRREEVRRQIEFVEGHSTAS